MTYGRMTCWHSAGDILHRLRQLANYRDKVSIGNILDCIGDKSYGSALLIPALIGAIFAGQLLWGKEHLRIPGFVRKR